MYMAVFTVYKKYIPGILAYVNIICCLIEYQMLRLISNKKEKLMKKLIAGSMAVLLSAPAFAGGQMYEQQTTSFLGWDILPYIAVRGGATYGNLNYNFNDTKESVTQNLYQARAALGLSMYSTARMEIEGSFFTKGKYTKGFGSMDNVEVTSNNIELMANTYMDLGKFHYIQPFFGLGAGLAFMKTEGNVPGYGVSKSDTNFSGMATLGLAMPFGCYTVDVAARYNYIDVQSGMHDFSGDIGIRYMF